MPAPLAVTRVTREARARSSVPDVAAAGDGAPDQEQHDRRDDRSDPVDTRGGLEDPPGGPSADHGADDADDDRADDAHRIVTRQQEPSQHANDEPDHQV